MRRCREHEEGVAVVPSRDRLAHLVVGSGVEDEPLVELRAVRDPGFSLVASRSAVTVVVRIGRLGLADSLPLGLDARSDARESVGAYRPAIRERQENLDVSLLGQGEIEDGIILVRVSCERVEAGAVEHDPSSVVPAPFGVKADDAAYPTRYEAGVVPTAPTPCEAAILRAESGDVEGAVLLLRREIESDAPDPNARLALGSVLLAAGRWEEAVVVLRDAVEEDEDLAVARVLLARALEGADRLDDAVFQLLRAAKLAPEDPAVLRELGGAFYRKGLYDKALQWLQKSRAAAAGNPKEEARALYAVGLAQEARRDPGAAIAAYKSAVEIDKGHLDARKTLADALAGIGEHERAIAVLDELLKVDPTNEKAAENREVLERALQEMLARRLVGKTVKELEGSVLVQAGQLKRRTGKGLLGRVADVSAAALLRRSQKPKQEEGKPHTERYSNALLELHAGLEADQTIASLVLVIRDLDANKRKDNVFQVTVVAKDGRREPASYATGASLTFLREAMGMPMTQAAELYSQLLAGRERVEYGGLEGLFATVGGPDGEVNGLLVKART
jgi:tetratricopeptide (TPR) repeat protein